MALPYVLVYFHRVAPAVVAGAIRSEFQLDGKTLGLLASLYFAIYALLQIPAGILADSLGPRRTIAAGSALAGIGSLLFGLAPTLELAFLGRTLVGAGVSFIFVPILKLHACWFEPRTAGTLSGLTLLLGNTGALLASSPLAWMSDLSGWRTPFLFTGALGILAAIISLWVVRDTPAQASLPWPPGYQSAGTTMTVRTASRGMWSVMRRPRNWIPFFAFAGIYGALMTFQAAWGSAFLQDVYGLNAASASSSLLFLALGLMIGSPLAGWTADRLGRPLVVYLAGTGLFAACLLVTSRIVFPAEMAVSGPLPLNGLLLLMGLGASVFILTWPIARSQNPAELAGSASGFANMGGFAGGAALPPVFGWILDASIPRQASGGYSVEAYGIAFALPLAALFCSLVLIAVALLLPGGPGAKQEVSSQKDQ